MVQKLVMRAELPQPHAIQHEEQVGILDGRETMRDNVGRATDHQPFKRGLNQALGLL